MGRIPLIFVIVLLAAVARAEPPGVSYIFPAGVQRGTESEVRVGGLYFHGRAQFAMTGPGVTAAPMVEATETIWFEGPLIFQPASQKSEDYPKDHLGKISVTKEAPLGQRRWHCRTSQGVTPSMPFVIGDLPEIIEKEIDGEPIPESVKLPLTINGRIFPREDVDIWQFEAAAGETIACEINSQRLGYPLEAALSVTGPDGRTIRPNESRAEGDPSIWFQATAAGNYQVRINDANFGGLQHFVYRLTIRKGAQVTHAFPLGGKRGETIQVEVAGPGFDKPTTIPVPLAGIEGDFTTVPVKIAGHSAGHLTLRVDDFPEVRESADPVAIPSIANGRIGKPGEVDEWPIDLGEKQTVLFEIEAATLGSRLESFLTVCDAEGKELAKNDDGIPGQPDSRLLYMAPKAGRYVVRIADQFDHRGGPEFGYRLKITEHEPIDFQLTLNKDAYTVVRDDPNAPELSEDEAKVALRAKRARGKGILVTLNPLGAFKSDVKLEFEGLPKGVSIAEDLLTLSFKKKSIELFFNAEPDIPVQLGEITVRGTAEIVEGDPKKAKKGEEELKTWSITREASIPVKFGETPVEKVRFAVAPHIPFKHLGQYRVTTGRPGGSTWVKHYEIDRGGFEGPLTVSLADKQLRHLQGTTAPVLTIPPGESAFDFPIKYLPNPELGRTCRVQLMLAGEMTDFDGSKHIVSYTSTERSDQIITVTSDGLLRVSAGSKTYAVTPGTGIEIPVTVHRAASIAGKPVEVELLVPDHVKDISAEPVSLTGKQETATLRVRIGKNPGPINLPIAIRSRTISKTGRFDRDAHIAEFLIELVPAPLQTAAK